MDGDRYSATDILYHDEIMLKMAQQAAAENALLVSQIALVDGWSL
jgi:hypothetical protein